MWVDLFELFEKKKMPFYLDLLAFHLRKRISVKVEKILFPRDVFEVVAIERLFRYVNNGICRLGAAS